MIYVIVGPTGIGKTKLSIALAKHLNTEIISGDSMQVYKGLNIGSAKVTNEEMQGINHHLIDILDPLEDFSVAIFQKMVRSKINDLQTRGKTPIIVGGTGLYIKSALYDYNFQNTMRDPNIEQEYKMHSNQELHQILTKKDEAAAKMIHPNNRKRVLQAISRSLFNKVSSNKNKDEKIYNFTMIGLTLDREVLYDRINQRVDLMFEKGLIQEVKGLYDKGVKGNAALAIGYKELYSYFEGKCTLEEAKDKIKQHSRNLAKKQFTFFNNQFDMNWFEVNVDDFEETIQEVIAFIEK